MTLTQEDREAAAEYLAALAPNMPNLAEKVAEGSTALARLLMRHRLAAEERGARMALEAAWRDGFNTARECLPDDDAYCLTADVEDDAWADSKTRQIDPAALKGAE